MVVIQRRSKRTVTGSRYKKQRASRKYEAGRTPTHTKVGERKFKTIRTRGGNSKPRLMEANMCNLADPKTNKMERVKVNSVVDCPANRHFARRNIIVKGAIIDTEKGRAKVTSRPGQDGIVNAVLLQ